MGSDKLLKKSTPNDVESFLAKVAVTPNYRKGTKPGRLIFALDATASRQPTWDHACQLQGEMFQETADIGGLEIQLAYFRGFGEFRVTPWAQESSTLLRQMASVFCLAGETQIKKVLRHTVNETKKQVVDALVFVGDCVEEDIDELGRVSGELGLLGVPIFVFQEGYDKVSEFAFKQITKLSNGAYCRLDQFSAKTLRELLSAVAVFAAGGKIALDSYAKKNGGIVLQIAHQMKGR